MAQEELGACLGGARSMSGELGACPGELGACPAGGARSMFGRTAAAALCTGHSQHMIATDQRWEFPIFYSHYPYNNEIHVYIR